MYRIFRRLLLCALIYGLACPPWVFAAPVVPDPAAPAGKRPAVDAAPNNVPLVNIARPNQAGLSHNQYTDFNVPREGIILNNSAREGVSQLGGVVYGNPHFQPGDAGASAILNEVTSSNRSHLEGYTEVFGQSADVILANPNGITINGGGFINVPRATLTTGVPQVENGQLRAFAVDKGDIRIEGAGINASNMDAFTLYSRTASLTADVHANDLTILTGRNRVDAVTGQAVPLPDVTGAAAPAVSLDSSLVGGMYAGRISLLSTEKGVGVNLQGSVQTGEGLRLTADGKLTLREAAAGQDMQLDARAVELTERTVARRNLAVTAAESATLRGSALAGGHVDVRARDVALHQAEVAAGVDGTAVSQPGDVRIAASRTLSADGSRVLAGRTAALDAPDVRMAHGVAASGAALAIRGATLNVDAMELNAGSSLDLYADRQLQSTGGRWTAAHGLTMRAGELSARALTVSAGDNLSMGAEGAAVLDDSELTSGATLGFSGHSLIMTRTTLLAMDDLTLTGASVTGTNLALTAGGNAALDAATDLALADADLGAVGNLTASAQNAHLTGGSLRAEGGLTLAASAGLGLNGVLLDAGNNLALRGASLNMVSGSATATRALDMTATDVLTLDGSVVRTGDSLALNGGALGLNGGSLLALGDLHLAGISVVGERFSLTAGGNAVLDAATDLALTDATLGAVGNLTASAQNADLTGGSLLANNEASLTIAHRLTLTDSLLNAGNGLNLDAGEDLRLNESTLKTGGDLHIRASAVAMEGGSLGAGDALALSGTALDFTRATLLAMGDVALTGTSLAGRDFKLTSGHHAILDAAGRLSLTNADLGAVGNLTAAAQTAGLRESSLAANNDLSLDIAADLNLTDNVLNAGRTMDVAAGPLSLSGNTLNAGDGLHVRAATAEFAHDQLRADGDLELSGDHFGFTAASLLAVRNLTLTGAGITGTDLALTAGGNASIAASSRLELHHSNLGAVDGLNVQALDALLSGNTLLAGGGMTIDAARALTLDANTLNAGGDLALTGGVVGLTSDTLKTGGSATLTGDTLELRDGELAATETLSLTADALTLNSGALNAVRDLALTGALTSTASTLTAGRNLTLSGNGDFRLQGGTFSAMGDLALTYASVATDGGLLASGQDLFLTAASLTNTGGALYAGRDAHYAIGGTLWNNGGELYAGRHMTIAGTAGDTSRAGRLLNQSGTVAADGDMAVRAVDVTNEKRNFAYQTGILVNSYDQELPFEVLSGEMILHKSETVAVYEDRLSGDSPAASLSVGRNLYLDSDILLNRFSFIAAGGDADLTAGSLTNEGAELRQTTRHNQHYAYQYHKHGDNKWTYADGPVTEEYVRIGLAPAAITAGGALSVRVSGDLNNYAAQATPFTPSHAAPSAPDAVDVVRPAQPDAVTTDTVDRPDDVAPDQVENPGGVTHEQTGSPDAGNPDLPDRPGSVELARPDASGPGHTPLYLPESPVFQANADPGHPYKMETNPALTSMASFYGSEYFLQRMDVDVADLQHRLLGDAFYETRLVQNQLLAETGRRFLNGYTNDADQMRALMNNAADLGQSMHLSVGVELTPAQAAALTKDIVWLVEEEYEGETVLVPKLYLAQASRESLLDGGATLAGHDVYLASDSNLLNSGDVRGETVRAVAQNILNQGGRIAAANMDLSALNDLVNQGGLISGDAVTLTAGRDLVSVSTTQSFANANTVGSQIASLAGVEARGDLSLAAGRDLILQGSALAAGGNASLLARRDLTLDTVASGFDMAVQSGKNSAREHLRQNTASSLDVGGSLTLASGRDAVAAGARISAGGDATLNAGGDMVVSAVTDEYSHFAHGSLKSGGMFGGSSSATVSTSQENVRGASIQAGGNLTLTAGSAGDPGAGNLSVIASTLAAQGDATLAASGDVLLAAAGESSFSSTASTDKGFLSAKASVEEQGGSVSVGSAVSGHDVTISGGDNVLVSGSTVTAENDLLATAGKGDVVVSATQDTSSSRSESMHSQWGLLGVHSGMFEVYSKTTEKAAAQNAANVGGILSAGHDLQLDAARDVTVIGSAVAAGNDLGLFAGRDVNLLPGQEYAASSHSKKEERIGVSVDFSSSGMGAFAGYTSLEQGVDHRGDYTAGSLASAGNDLIIEAGRDVNQIGSHMEAGRDVLLDAGQDWNMTASYDTQSLTQYIKQTQAGISASVRLNAADAAQTLARLPEEAVSAKGGAGYSALTAAGAGMKAVDAVAGGLHEAASASIGIMASTSRSDASASSSTARPSTVYAGRDVDAAAGRDIAIEGGQMMAGRDALLDAGRDLIITSALNASSASSSSSSAGGSFGLKGSFGTNGPAAGINVSASASGANSSGSGTSHTDSAILAGDTLATSSGRDTAVAGARLEADSVWMDAGRNLTVASLQDHSENKSSSWSVGGSLTVGLGASPIVGSVNVGFGKGSGTSDWTGDQTSILGHQEVDIRVEDDTHIKGAIIGAENGNLTLDTGTLTYETVEDRDHGSRFDVSAGVGFSSDKEKGGTFAPAPDSLEVVYGSHDKQGVLYPTVGEGTIIVRDDPQADLSGLNRDLKHTRDITRDDETYVDFYVSRQALEEIATGFAGITSQVTGLANQLRAFTATLPEGCEGTGKLGLDAYKSMLREGVSDEVAEKVLRDVQFQSLVQQAGELAGVLQHTDLDLLYQKDASYPTGNIDPTSTTIYYNCSPGESLITLMVEVSDFINSIPYQEERDAAMLAIQAVTGGPIKLAISYGVNLAIDYVAGDMIQAAKDTLFGTFVSYVAAGTSIEGLEEKAIGPNPTEEAHSDYQTSFDKTVQGVTTTTELVIGAVGALKPGKKPGHGADADHPLIPHNAETLFQELTEKGSKFSRDKIVAIEKMPDGKIVYLETGDKKRGLEHILTHFDGFEDLGIVKSEVPAFIMRLLREGKIVGYQGKGTGRPLYAIEINGKMVKFGITVSSNGYIVGANRNTK